MALENTPQSIPKYKCVFVGDIFVGKTSIITRFMYDTFLDKYKGTVGIDFLAKTMYLEDRTVRLHLWDTAGQERFKCLIANYIRDSNAAIVVFDVTSKATFESVDGWIQEIKDERGSQTSIFLVGNKTDEKDKREVTTEEAFEKAKQASAEFIETSAKSGDNIKQLFKMIACSLPAAESNPPANELNDIRLGESFSSNQDPKKGCFC